MGRPAAGRASGAGTVAARKETVRGVEYEVTWKGSDVVDIAPHGEPLRLYQRAVGVPKEIPEPPARKAGPVKGFDARPTEQKR